MKEALDYKTNSPCQQLRKCIKNRIENIHADVRVFKVRQGMYSLSFFLEYPLPHYFLYFLSFYNLLLNRLLILNHVYRLFMCYLCLISSAWPFLGRFITNFMCGIFTLFCSCCGRPIYGYRPGKRFILSTLDKPRTFVIEKLQ